LRPLLVDAPLDPGISEAIAVLAHGQSPNAFAVAGIDPALAFREDVVVG
jgi:hypothetical protein